MLFNFHSVLNTELSNFLYLPGKSCFFGVYDDEVYKMHFTKNNEMVKEREHVRLLETYQFLG